MQIIQWLCSGKDDNSNCKVAIHTTNNLMRSGKLLYEKLKAYVVKAL